MQERQINRANARRMLQLFESYHARWMDARNAAFERWLADTLGLAREHRADEYRPLAVEVPPRHLMTSNASVLRGIDRSVDARPWTDIARATKPITVDEIREGMRRLLEHRPPPPVFKPWLPRHRAEELIAEGISPALIVQCFQIF